jgi:hypothetical protein
MISVLVRQIMNTNSRDWEQVESEIDASVSTLKSLMKERDTFFNVEKNLRIQIFQLACLYLKLFLMYHNSTISIEPYLSNGLYRLKNNLIERTLKTSFGKVAYKRKYLINRKGGSGIYPLDIILGLLSDNFSPLVIDMCCRLSTRLSYKASVLVFKWFCNWTPSTDSVECLVLGLGRKASEYMDIALPPENEGEMLVIEVDGKATPTATDEELAKRRGPRDKKHNPKCKCGCQRHRGKAKRFGKKKVRKKKGDKSKNGRSITLVAMYTLKKSPDGKLHGPLNKKIWGSYNTRKFMFEWIRKQAQRRGFDPSTSTNIQLIMDGEKCLENSLREIFPKAIFTLDIRHLEEKLWDVGRSFHKEGSEELAEWVSDRREMLYNGNEKKLLKQLQDSFVALSKRAERDAKKREALEKLIFYMTERMSMMNYKKLIDQDLVISSGIIEGAARYVVGERMDCSGMRWIMGRAEALLHLRCMELNNDWENFFHWTYQQWTCELQKGIVVKVRSAVPIPIDKEVA